MRRTILTAVASAMTATTIAFAQTQPPPGPNKPPPTNSPLAKPGADMVINPTIEECRMGWNASLKWTKEQFENHCAQMKASK